LKAANLRERARLEAEAARKKTQKPVKRKEPPQQGEAAPRRQRWGSYEAEIVKVEILDGNGRPRQVFDTGEAMIVRLHYRAHQRIERPVFGIAIHRSDGVHITGPNTRFSEYDIPYLEGSGVVEYVIPSLPMLAGQYELSCSLYDYDFTYRYDYHERAYTFRIQPGSVKEKYGAFRIPCEWRYIPDGA